MVIGGIAISTTLPPSSFAGPIGTGPPCGAVMGPFGWLIAFWVRKNHNLKNILNNFFFLIFLITVNPSFLWYKHIPVGHPRPFHFPGKFHFSRLTAWKAYGYWKKEVNTPLFDIIWRDGFLYFFVIFSMNAANVIIFSTVPEALRAFNLTLRRFNSLKIIVIWCFFFY